MGDESDRPVADMWKVWPLALPPTLAEWDLALLSMEDSTLGKGWRSPRSCGGGVRAWARGDAVYEWFGFGPKAERKGGREARLVW